MIGGWWLVWGILGTFGLPLVAVGAVLRLCEAGWEKPGGSMGSYWLLGVGGLLCLPVLLYLAPVLLEHLSR
jgi:hypothetical protein